MKIISNIGLWPTQSEVTHNTVDLVTAHTNGTYPKTLSPLVVIVVIFTVVINIILICLQFLVEENDAFQKEKLQEDFNDAYPFLRLIIYSFSLPSIVLQ